MASMLRWSHAVVAGGVLLALGGCIAESDETGGSSEQTRWDWDDDDDGRRECRRDGADGEGDDCEDDEVPPPPPPPPPDPDCVNRTLAQWIEAPGWPTASLEIAGVVYSEAQLRAILELDGHADASITAAQELIVALLNQCAGCVVPDPVQDAINECDDWFEDNVDWDFDGDGAIPYCIPPRDELTEGLRMCLPVLEEFNSSAS